MASVPLENRVAAYNRGMITGHELVLRLIQAAVHHPPEEILPLVPEELLDEVKQQGMNPPERPETMRFGQMISNIGPYDSAAWEREQQATYYDGAWRWHRFLTDRQA